MTAPEASEEEYAAAAARVAARERSMLAAVALQCERLGTGLGLRLWKDVGSVMVEMASGVEVALDCTSGAVAASIPAAAVVDWPNLLALCDRMQTVGRGAL
jgi:hypothetical protein